MSAQPVTLVTGASSGIGAALAQEFAAHGHAVLMVARRQGELDHVADTIAAQGHARPQVLALDLGAPEASDALAAAMTERGLEPSIVVNNAGFGLLGLAEALDRADQVAMIELNARMLTELSLRFLDSVERHRGGILNVASIAGFMPGPGLAVYHATKAYVLSFTEALHQEMKTKGVRVTALCPGPVPTPFMTRAGIPQDHFPSFLALSAEQVARAGYDGFMSGRRVVTPGLGNKIVTLLPRLLPRGLLLQLMDRR